MFTLKSWHDVEFCEINFLRHNGLNDGSQRHLAPNPEAISCHFRQRDFSGVIKILRGGEHPGLSG
jgi:hypothetical protein